MFSLNPKISMPPGRLLVAAVALAVVGTVPAIAATSAPERDTADRAAAGSAVKVKLKIRKQVSNQTDVRAKVRVTSAGKMPAGRLLIRQGKQTLAKVAVPARSHPSAVLKLRLATGEHDLYAVFWASGKKGRSSMKTVTSNAGCAWKPESCGYPGRSNTGPRPGVVLRDVPGDVRSGKGWHYDERGWIDVDGDGAVLDGIRTTSSVEITASNVTISNSQIQVTGETWGIGMRTGSGITIERNEISSPVAVGDGRMLVGIKDIYGTVSGVVISGNEISHASTGIQVDSGTLQDNFIHSMGYRDGDHLNGITSNGGSDPLVIRHNTVLNQYDQTDAIGLFQDFGVQANRVIDRNLIGGGGYTIYAGANPGKESGATNVTVTDNRFAQIYHPRSGYFGPATAYYKGGGNAWSGNVWDSSGKSVGAP